MLRRSRGLLAGKLARKTALHLEALEDRCLPSTTLPFDPGAGLNGDELFDDPLFASDHNSKALLAALAGQPGAQGTAGNAATPITGQGTISMSASQPVSRSSLSGVGAITQVVIEAPNATITVNTLKDEYTVGGSDPTLSLREAIYLVNGKITVSQLSAAEKAQVVGIPGPNSLIEFASGLSGVIHTPGLPTITAKYTTIQGQGITLENAFNGYTLEVGAGASATISGMTFADGFPALGNKGTLTVTNCAFNYNIQNSTFPGGAIIDFAASTLNVQGCTFTGNATTSKGGAIYGTSDTLNISNSTFSGNSSVNGGAVYDLKGAVSITGCTFDGNTANVGGAIMLSQVTSASITGTTFTNNKNTDTEGAAIYTHNCTAVTIQGCSFTANRGFDLGIVADVGSKAVTISGDTFTGNYGFDGMIYGSNDAMTISNTAITNNSSYSGGGIFWKATVAGSLTVTNSTITGNFASKNAGSVYLNNGKFTASFTNCYFASNYAYKYGGAVDVKGAATFSACTFTKNSTAGAGGAIYNNSTTHTVTLNQCTISGNQATAGGGIYNSSGTLDVFNSTVSGNSATTGNGGGIYNLATLNLLQCTVADNTAVGKGGGIFENSATATWLGADTIAFNQAASGGGLYAKSGNAYLQNTIVAQNTITGSSTASDITGTLKLANCYNNLIGTGGTGGITTAQGNQINVANPGLEPLASNGGLTQTIMLQSTSPAINAGSNAKATIINSAIGGLATDQRGLTRTVGGTVDIGSVEVQAAGTPTHFVIQQSPQVSAGVPFTLGVTVEDDFGTIITGFTGTVSFSSSDVAAVLPANYTFTAADAGFHAFSATLNTLGTQSITITDAADKLVGQSFTKVITPPATGAFFTDGNNQLWLFSGGKFTNTGGFAKIFSAGIDTAGHPECWFLDGNNQLWRYDNGVFTNTGGFAQKIAAGQGFVAFTDGVNQIWTFTDAGSKFTNTGGFASRFTAGFDVVGNNQIVFADGINQLWTYNVTTGVFHNTGGFTKSFVAGQDAFGNNEIWFTDGNNQIWRLDNGTFTKMNAFALTITGAGGGQMFFSDGINQIWNLTDFGVATNTGGFASHISSSPGTIALFFSDGINQLWELFDGVFTNTGGFASKFSAF
jgi:predicted outer membrane repeat protein